MPPLEHAVSCVPREHQQMNNKVPIKLAYYILLERTERNRGWSFRASLFSCNVKTVQINLDRHCPTVRCSSFTMKWHSLAFSEKKVIIIWRISPAVCEHTQMFPALCVIFFLSNITFQNTRSREKKYFPAILLLDAVAGGCVVSRKGQRALQYMN